MHRLVFGIRVHYPNKGAFPSPALTFTLKVLVYNTFNLSRNNKKINRSRLILVCIYYRTVQTVPPKPASVPVVQLTSPGKSTNQTFVSTPAAQSNASAPVKLPYSPVLSDPNYSGWSPWSKRSATCGPKAVMYRERTCKLIGGTNCQGSNIQTKLCQFVKCPGI